MTISLTFYLRYFCLGQSLNRTAGLQVGTETVPDQLGHADTLSACSECVIEWDHIIYLPVGFFLRIWTITSSAFIKWRLASNWQDLFITSGWFPAFTQICVSDSIIIKKQQNLQCNYAIIGMDPKLWWDAALILSENWKEDRELSEGFALYHFWKTY